MISTKMEIAEHFQKNTHNTKKALVAFDFPGRWKPWEKS